MLSRRIKPSQNGFGAIVFLLLVVLSGSSLAETRGFKTRIVRDGNDFAFPIFSSGNHERTSIRINQFLQLSELFFVSKNPSSSDIFHQAKANDGSIYGGKFFISPNIYSNNRRVLSLGFNESSSGATTHYWVQYYTFNSGNGDHIALSDLFTPDGYRTFTEMVLKRRSAKYRKEVNKKIQRDEQEAFFGVLGSFEHDDLSDFYIQRNSIVIDGQNLLGKSLIGTDLDMTVTFALPVFKKYLNEYGRSLFGLGRADISKYRSTILPQLFEGTVNGTYPIAMVLDIDSKNEFGTYYRGYYAYQKYGEALMISGDDTKGQIDLTEHVLSPTVINNELGPHRRVQNNGYISGKLSGLTFSGTWTDLSQSKQLTFYASVD